MILFKKIFSVMWCLKTISRGKIKIFKEKTKIVEKHSQPIQKLFKVFWHKNLNQTLKSKLNFCTKNIMSKKIITR